MDRNEVRMRRKKDLAMGVDFCPVHGGVQPLSKATPMHLAAMRWKQEALDASLMSIHNSNNS